MASLFTKEVSEEFVQSFEDHAEYLDAKLSPSSRKYLHLILFALANEKPPARLDYRIGQPEFEIKLIDYLNKNFDSLFADTVKKDLEYENDNSIFPHTQPEVTFFHVQHFIDIIRVRSNLFLKIDLD